MTKTAVKTDRNAAGFSVCPLLQKSSWQQYKDESVEAKKHYVIILLVAPSSSYKLHSRAVVLQCNSHQDDSSSLSVNFNTE